MSKKINQKELAEFMQEKTHDKGYGLIDWYYLAGETIEYFEKGTEDESIDNSKRKT